MIASLDDRHAFFGGALSYRQLLAMPFLLPLFSEFVFTAGAAGRLRAWGAEGGPDAQPDAVRYCGDHSIGVAVRDAVSQLPPPVRSYLARAVIVLGTGAETGGWFASLPPASRVARLRLIAVGRGNARSSVEAIVAHEAAHAWLEDDERVPDVVRYFDGGADAVLADLARRERQAAWLARAWGFVGDAADPARAASSSVAAARLRYGLYATKGESQ